MTAKTSSIEPAGTRLLDAFRADVLEGAPLPCTAIHQDDFMLRFFIDQQHGHWEGALVDYFRSGHSGARAIERLLRWWFGHDHREIRLLDFASGYGRLTRFFVQHLSPRQVWVSDIFPAAVEFQQRTFGVHGFPSTRDAQQLCCEETFDCIVVSSLFSHLPERTFIEWLRRLFGLLRPGGVLLMTVHDRSLRGTKQRGAGLEFEPLSEIPELAGEQYGTSWVDEAFVRAAIATATGGASYARLPRGMWSFQDLYIVGRDRPVPPPPEIREPLGYLERATRSPDGRRLTLSGWASGLEGVVATTVEVRLDGELLAHCPVGLLRPDVAAVFGDETARSGWAVSVAGAARGSLPGESILSLTARAESGSSFLIHLATVEATCFAMRLRSIAPAREEAAESRAERLAAELAHMRSSRFWKLRDAWWGLKQTLRLHRS